LNLNYIYFLLELREFVPILKNLLENKEYLNYCYEKDSILSTIDHRDDLISIFELLEQFEFDLGYIQKNNSILITQQSIELTNKFKIISNAVFKFFEQKLKNGVLLVNICNDYIGNTENPIANLIREKYIPLLEDLFTHGIKINQSNFQNYILWNIIESLSNFNSFIAKYVNIINNLEFSNFQNLHILKLRIFICILIK
jgi:hypothetical protein